MAEAGAAAIRVRALEEQLRARNGAYDSTTSLIWQLGVYEPVHAGLRFANIGGRTVLSFIGRMARLGPDACALEIGSGLAETCRFLSERFGCRVVGVDMNASQVRHARQMAEAAGMTERLVFVQANIEDRRAVDELRTLLPAAGADLIYTLDVLMLTADPGAIIRSAAQLVRPNGWLALAEVTSGPATTKRLRDSLWETDGMRSLLAPADYAGLIRDAGFAQLRIIDRTPLAVDCFTKMASAFANRESELVAAVGRAQWEGWRDVTDLYLECFRDGRLLYTQLLAR